MGLQPWWWYLEINRWFFWWRASHRTSMEMEVGHVHYVESLIIPMQAYLHGQKPFYSYWMEPGVLRNGNFMASSSGFVSWGRLPLLRRISTEHTKPPENTASSNGWNHDSKRIFIETQIVHVIQNLLLNLLILLLEIVFHLQVSDLIFAAITPIPAWPPSQSLLPLNSSMYLCKELKNAAS